MGSVSIQTDFNKLTYLGNWNKIDRHYDDSHLAWVNVSAASFQYNTIQYNTGCFILAASPQRQMFFVASWISMITRHGKVFSDRLFAYQIISDRMYLRLLAWMCIIHSARFLNQHNVFFFRFIRGSINTFMALSVKAVILTTQSTHEHTFSCTAMVDLMPSTSIINTFMALSVKAVIVTTQSTHGHTFSCTAMVDLMPSTSIIACHHMLLS